VEFIIDLYGNYLLNYCWLIDLEILHQKDASFDLKHINVMGEGVGLPNIIDKKEIQAQKHFEDIIRRKEEEARKL
jgi:hypothetical protein